VVASRLSEKVKRLRLEAVSGSVVSESATMSFVEFQIPPYQICFLANQPPVNRQSSAHVAEGRSCLSRPDSKRPKWQSVSVEQTCRKSDLVGTCSNPMCRLPSACHVGKNGGFLGVSPQQGIGSIHKHAIRFGNIDLANDPNVVLVLVLAQGKAMGAPTADEVTGWAAHFETHRGKNQNVPRYQGGS
jgi:hypothetical protein